MNETRKRSGNKERFNGIRSISVQEEIEETVQGKGTVAVHQEDNEGANRSKNDSKWKNGEEVNDKAIKNDGKETAANHQAQKNISTQNIVICTESERKDGRNQSKERMKENQKKGNKKEKATRNKRRRSGKRKMNKSNNYSNN